MYCNSIKLSAVHMIGFNFISFLSWIFKYIGAVNDQPEFPKEVHLSVDIYVVKITSQWTWTWREQSTDICSSGSFMTTGSDK